MSAAVKGGGVGGEVSLDGGQSHSDDEVAVARGDLARVVPFYIARRTVPQVDGFPISVVARVKGPTRFFKLVGKNESVFLGRRNLFVFLQSRALRCLLGPGDGF